MNLVMFSGNSLANQDWIHEVDARVKELFDQTYVQEYRHWHTGEKLIDIDHEETVAAEAVKNLSPYILFGKSLGSVLAIKGMADGTLIPERCVFVGLPTVSIQQLRLPVLDWLNKVSAPITIIQNEYDPYGSYEEVKAYLEGFDIALIKTPGDTHDYLSYAQITQLLTA